MRLLFISALMLLGACATTAPAAPSAATAAATASTPAPSRAAQLLGTAGRPNAASRADLERALGAPDIERRDGAGVALTYRLESCALLLLLTADGHNQMRLAEAHASARRVGEATPTIEQCAAEAAARRS